MARHTRRVRRTVPYPILRDLYNGHMAKKTKTPAPRRGTWAKLDRARELARGGIHSSLASIAKAVGFHESTLRSHHVMISSGVERPEFKIPEPTPTPDRRVPAVAHHPNPEGPTPPKARTDEESSRLAKAQIGGAGYFETSGGGDKAKLGRRELRRAANKRLALVAERVASFPQHTYQEGNDQDQRDIFDCASAAGVLDHSKRPYNARQIQRLANRFRRTKLGRDAPKVSTAAVLETVHREQSRRA